VYFVTLHPTPSSPARLSLFRCNHCGRTQALTPTELKVSVQGIWPQCCGLDLILYIEAERPGSDATEVAAFPLAFPGMNTSSDTAVLPPPSPRAPAE
jgi:hypothetical protein